MTKRKMRQWYRHGTWWRKLRINRRYKDVLFRRLFRNKQDLLDLYNALNGSTYTVPEGLKEGLRKGLEKGRDEKLRELVQKKLSRGKSVLEIAEDLEEEVSVIEQIAACRQEDLH